MLHIAPKFDLYLVEEKASVFEQWTVACVVQYQRNFGILCRHLVSSMNGGNVRKCLVIIIITIKLYFMGDYTVTWRYSSQWPSVIIK